MGNYLKISSPIRADRGTAMISLCLVLSLFLIFMIFFTFDLNRVQMAQRQVQALCDAAALAGSAMLTAKDVSFEDPNLDTLYTTQMAAMQYSRNMLAMGNILGQQCYDPSAGSSASGIALNYVSSSSTLANPGPNQLNCWVQLCAPANNFAVVSPGNSSGRAVFIQGAYGYVPFLSVIGIGTLSLPAQSTSSLQRLNIVMAFDCSGSMDDDTVVSFVYRRWTQAGDANNGANNGKGQYVYQVVGNSGSGATAGQLWQYTGLDYNVLPNGTALNVLPPQNLDYLGFVYANQHYSYTSSDTNFHLVSPPLAFDAAIASYIPWVAGTNTNCYNSTYTTYKTNGSTGFAGPVYDNYYGTPPGNCRVKYGPAPSGATYAQVLADNVNANVSMNIWNGSSLTMAPGPGSSPGYFYYPNGPNNPTDGNLYFYDPYSMPNANTNTNYAAFTDLVANLVDMQISTSTAPFGPPAQPLYGPAAFSGFTHTFPASGDGYSIPIAETSSVSQTWSAAYEWDATLNTLRTYKFSNIAYLVEASRGNLDTDWNANSTGYTNRATNYDNALLACGSNYSSAHPTRADCQAGYQKAYQRLAMYVMQPYATAVDGAYRFFQNLVQTSACNFGIIGFSVTPATTANYNCAYVNQPSPGVWSLGLTATAHTTKPDWVFSSYVYQPPFKGLNPNFWVTTPFASPNNNANIAPSGPAGSPTGSAYHATYNTAGPTQNTWMKVYGGVNPSNSDTLWAFNNVGFQIPRAALRMTNQAYQSYFQVAGDNWSGYRYDYQGYSQQNPGMNGLLHARPLYETQGKDALATALYNLTSVSLLDNQIAFSSGLTLTPETGVKKALVFFTDGVPTDSNSPFTDYQNYIVGNNGTTAQSQGVAVYAVGLALNPTIAVQQHQFLAGLANLGANGSQFYQVTSNATLTGTFNGIARQLAQCQR